MSATITPLTKTRDRLIQAARSLFYTEGYGISVDAIAQYAEVAKPTLYAHFKSKEHLIEAVLETRDEQWFQQLDVLLKQRSGDLRAQLIAPFDLLAEDLDNPAYHGCLLVNSAATFTSPNHVTRRVLVTHEQRMLGIFKNLGVQAGVLEPNAFARKMLLLYGGVKARGLADPSEVAVQDARDAAVALLQTATTPIKTDYIANER